MDLNVLCDSMGSMTHAERAEALATVEEDPDLPLMVKTVFRHLCEIVDVPYVPESPQGAGFGRAVA